MVIIWWIMGISRGFPKWGYPQNGGFVRENPIYKWMMTGGDPLFWQPPNLAVGWCFQNLSNLMKNWDSRRDLHKNIGITPGNDEQKFEVTFLLKTISMLGWTPWVWYSTIHDEAERLQGAFLLPDSQRDLEKIVVDTAQLDQSCQCINYIPIICMIKHLKSPMQTSHLMV